MTWFVIIVIGIAIVLQSNMQVEKATTAGLLVVFGSRVILFAILILGLLVALRGWP